MRNGVWRRLWVEVRGSRSLLLWLLALEIAAVPLALAAPVPLAIAVDTAIGDEPLPRWLDAVAPDAASTSPVGGALLAAALVLLLALLDHLRGIASWLLGAWTGQRLLLRMRSRLFRHAQRLSLAHHDARGTTDAIFRIHYDAAAVQQLATDGLAPVVTSLLTLVGMVVVTARLDAVVTAVTLSTIPVLALVTRRYQRRLRTGWAGVKTAESTSMAVLHEVLGSLRVVTAFGGEVREASRYETNARRTMKGELRMAVLEAGMWVAVGMTMALCSAAVLFVGVAHVQSGRLSLGDMLLIVAYASMISGPLETLSRHVGDLQSSLASAERAFELLDVPESVVERRGAQPVDRVSGSVAFEHVTYRHGPEGGGVRDVSFVIERGSCVGLSGPTGAGKTTLVSLLSRLFDPDEGTVQIDGVDVRDYRLADLRNQFAIVLQEPVLFSISVAENIAYSTPGATHAEIERAARRAEAHDFILELPDGYDTVLGERGSTLSGGQRQRLSVARAFLRDAPILVLDEPTSAVDVATEERMMRSLRRLVAGRTVFLISHRPQVLELCDVLLTVDDGVVSVARSRRRNRPLRAIRKDERTLERAGRR